jgi:hypothetical protein
MLAFPPVVSLFDPYAVGVMARTFRHALVLMLFLFGSSASAQGAEVTVGDRQIQIAVHPGFCELDGNNELDKLLLKMATDVQKGINEVVAYWIECRQLSDLRSGKTDQFYSYILVLAQLDRGKIRPVDLPLSQFLLEMKRVIAETNGFDDTMAEIEKSQRERFAKVLDELGANPGSMTFEKPQLYWLIAEDARAIYHGMIQEFVVNGRHTLMGGTFAMTELNGLSVTVNAYDEYRGSETFDLLKTQASGIVANMVAMNPTIPQ